MNEYIIGVIVITFFALIFIGVVIGAKEVQKNPEPLYPPTIGDYNQFELDIVYGINKTRQSRKMTLLKFDDRISILCFDHTNYSRRLGKVSSKGSNDRINNLREKLRVQRLGELVISGYEDVESVLERLLYNPENVKIVLGDFNKVGISVQKSRTGKMYMTLILAKIN